MKALFDISTIVAALVQAHPHHTRAIPWLQRAKQKEIEGAVSTHSLAEVYNVLTKRLQISPEMALELIEVNILDILEIVPLAGEDYHAVLQHLVGLKMSGPIVYDGLIAYAAWKAQADFLVTMNKKHFDTLYPAQTGQIIEP